MPDQFERTERIFGSEDMEKLKRCRVAVFGIGGVGGYVVEALARSGIGALDLVDDDRVCLSNLNRQIIATHKTIGRYKVDVAEERVLDICPKTLVRKHPCFFMPDTADRFDFTQYDYVVDAIDTVKGKLEIILRAKEAGIPVISCMGAGNKVDPTLFRVVDIYKTKVCPLARVMRTELRRRGVESLKVVYSEEPPVRPVEEALSCQEHCDCPPGTEKKSAVCRAIPGSTAFVPSVAGLIIAGEVIKDLISFRHSERER